MEVENWKAPARRVIYHFIRYMRCPPQLINQIHRLYKSSSPESVMKNISNDCSGRVTGKNIRYIFWMFDKLVSSVQNGNCQSPERYEFSLFK